MSDTRQKLLKLQAQIVALDYMVQRLYMFQYAASGMTEAQIRQAHASLLTKIRGETFPVPNPGLAALASGETEEAFADFLNGLERMLEEMGLLKAGQ